MKVRSVLGAAAVLASLAGMGCETAHHHARVSYPESVAEGSSDRIGYAVFSPAIQDRIYARKVELDAKTAVAGADDSGN
jgi:hypothetical protein